MFNILYVDDEDGLLEVGKAFLERSGDLHVDTVLSALEVDKMMAEKTYEAIISDYRMPDMNGIELLKHVRAQNASLPFILFTGKGREEVVIEALNNGVTFYIQKGGDPKAQFLELEYKVKQAVVGHRNEVELRRSEERFRSLIVDAPIAITIVQNDLISYANPRFLAMFGLSEMKEVQGLPLDDMLLHMDQQGGTPLSAIQGMRAPRRADNEFMGIRKQGTMFPVHIAFSQVNLSDGKGVLAFVTDITGRLKAEDALRRSESRFRAIYNEAAVGIVITDLTGVPREFNDELVRFFGYSRTELGRMRLFDLAHPDDRGRVLDDFNQLLLGNVKTYEAGTRYVCKDGQVKWAHVTVTILDEIEGDLPHVLVIFKDLTEAMRKEEERRATMTQLSLAMDLGEFASWEYDVRTKTYIFNDRFYMLYGTDVKREGGYHMLAETYIREFMHPDDIDRVREHFRNFVYSTTFAGDVREVEHRIIRRDGQVRTILVKASSYRDLKGNRLRDFGVNQDITRYKQAEGRYLKARQKLELLGSITRHDIKNQLQVQTSNLELAMRETTDPAVLERLEKVEESIMAVKRQIDFTKDYDMMGSMLPQWHSIEEIMAKIPQPDEGRIEVGEGIKGLKVLADPMLTMVFNNLVENSMKYADRPSSLLLTIEAHQNGNELTLTYRDNGVGISPADRERLFTKGFGKGTGLGLFLSKEILAITGIMIREDGEVGKGVKFDLTMPRGAYQYDQGTAH